MGFCVSVTMLFVLSVLEPPPHATKSKIQKYIKNLIIILPI